MRECARVVDLEELAHALKGLGDGEEPEVGGAQQHQELLVVPGHHARQAAGMSMTLPTTERRVWHCGDHTAKLASAAGGRPLIVTRICCVSVACGSGAMTITVHELRASYIYVSPRANAVMAPESYGSITSSTSARGQMVLASLALITCDTRASATNKKEEEEEGQARQTQVSATARVGLYKTSMSQDPLPAASHGRAGGRRPPSQCAHRPCGQARGHSQSQ